MVYIVLITTCDSENIWSLCIVLRKNQFFNPPSRVDQLSAFTNSFLFTINATIRVHISIWFFLDSQGSHTHTRTHSIRELYSRTCWNHIFGVVVNFVWILGCVFFCNQVRSADESVGGFGVDPCVCIVGKIRASSSFRRLYIHHW